MKNILSPFTGVALAAAGVPGELLAQESAPLRIFTAVEVDFSTESGKVYQLQGSSNLVDWVNIGAPVLGVGRDLTQVFSTRQGGEIAFGSYRVESVAPPTNALAPWSLAGTTLSLDDTPGDDLMQFTTSTNGVDLGIAPDPFRYQFTRTPITVPSAPLPVRGTMTVARAGRGATPAASRQGLRWRATAIVLPQAKPRIF